MIDAIACESHFLDHLAPVWLAMPESLRGEFVVDRSLVERARLAGIDPHPIEVSSLRRTPQVGPVRHGRRTLVAAVGDVKIGRRLGHGPFAFLEHGAGQAYGPHGAAASYAGGPDRADNELFLVPNEYSAALWRAAYPQARVEVIGCPKLETLPEREPGLRPVVAVSFHGNWPSAVPYGGNAAGDFLPALPALAERFTVIGHGHPGKGWGQRIARSFARLGIEFVPEFADVCRRADVYVCDNSSTIFEFASTGRPVVLMNARHWQRGHGPGGRFWDWAHVGVNADRPDDLVSAVELALEDAPEQRSARNDALGNVYAYPSGASERAVAALVEWDVAEAVAA